MIKYKLNLIKTKEIEIEAKTLREAKEIAKNKYGKDIEIQTELQVRTIKQNNALHKYFGLISNELNEKGITWDDLKLDWELLFTQNIIKEHIWKPIQKELFGKASTKQLFKSGDIDKIYDTINKKLSELGIYIPFPSMSDK